MCLKEKAYYFLIGFFCLKAITVSAQDQRVADSLVLIYKEDKLGGIEKLELLRNLSFNELNDNELSIEYAEELITQSRLDDNYLYLYRGYLQKGINYKLIGDLETALEAFFKSIEAAKKAKFKAGEGSAYMSVADVYSVLGNYDNSQLYYNKSIELLRKANDSIALASALLNLGDSYLNSKKYESALQNFEESGFIFKNVNYPIGTAYNLGNIGMVYAEQGKDDLATVNINKAITMLEELQDYYPISVYLTYMSDIYLKKGEKQVALNYAKRSLELAQQYGLKEQISDANLKLSVLYDQAGNHSASYKHYKDHITYRDSVTNIKSVQQMADLRTNYEVSQKQVEVDLLTQQKKNQKIIVFATAIALFLICLLAFGLYRRYKFIQKTNQIIEKEKNRSEALLLNILPEETAQELKEHGKIQAKKFDLVTVLFTDFKGFTKFAETEDPEHLVKSIDFYFKAFDEITTKYGLEKIKTIGDAYMCAGGLPTVNQTHARDVIYAAKEIIEHVKNEFKAKDDLIHFEIRIGVHTGPVIAGIVGIKKWQYDIWGDTVNIASRMEARSEPGKVNLSEATFDEIKDEFPCIYRGEIDVKNRGSLKMYFLS